MAVTAIINPKCSLVVNNLDFGNYDLAANNDSSTTIIVNCSLNAQHTLTANSGTNAVNPLRRSMSNGTAMLLYNLYTDTGRTTVFGDGTNGSVPITGTGKGVNVPITYTVYGRIPINQDVGTGSFKDIVTITITF